ncbi:MAG: hypothetical protein CM15mP103_11540 [Gammaproteobacteria bacterium]|nr:MAG: hypothetical protein CM15mP103_11540 [Gammaproteobacteria bacterium]
MLIDLGRNDLGRVSEAGSVSLTENMVIERYSHVMHIVSNVTGARVRACLRWMRCAPITRRHLSGRPRCVPWKLSMSSSR